MLPVESAISPLIPPVKGRDLRMNVLLVSFPYSFDTTHLYEAVSFAENEMISRVSDSSLSSCLPFFNQTNFIGDAPFASAIIETLFPSNVFIVLSVFILNSGLKPFVRTWNFIESVTTSLPPRYIELI